MGDRLYKQTVPRSLKRYGTSNRKEKLVVNEDDDLKPWSLKEDNEIALSTPVETPGDKDIKTIDAVKIIADVGSEGAPKTEEDIKLIEFTNNVVNGTDSKSIDNAKKELAFMAIHCLILDREGRFPVFSEREGKIRNIPGGKLKIGESISQSWTREMEEEFPPLAEQWGELSNMVPRELSDNVTIVTSIADIGCWSLTILILVDDITSIGFNKSQLFITGDSLWCQTRATMIMEGKGNYTDWGSVKNLGSGNSMGELIPFWADWESVKVDRIVDPTKSELEVSETVKPDETLLNKPEENIIVEPVHQ